MAVPAVVEMGRAAHLLLLIDTAVIRRKTGEVINEQTGKLEPQMQWLYTGPCRVKIENAQVRLADPGGQEGAVVRPILEIPAHSTAAVRKGDTAAVASTSPGVDATLYKVLGERAGSTSTVRRFEVEAVERGT